MWLQTFYFIVILFTLGCYPDGIFASIECGSTNTSSSGSFSSPNYPGYASNLSCTWRFTTAPDTIIVLQFTSFEVQGPLGCPYDKVSIYDGVNATSDVIGVYCHTDGEGGTTIPRFIRTSGNEMTVTFETDSSQEYAGFQAIYWTSYDCSVARYDIGFILDSSGSVGSYNFMRSLDFLRYTLLGLDVESGKIKVGLVLFASQAYHQFYLNTYNTKEDMFQAIESVVFTGGGTYTAAGLRYARQSLFNSTNGDRPDVPNLAILIVDGTSNNNAHETIPEARLCDEEGITVRVLAINSGTFNEGREIASEPKVENLFLIDNYDALFATRDLSYYPLCMPPRHVVEVFATTDNFGIGTRHTFYCNSSLNERDVEQYVWFENSEEFTRTSSKTVELDINTSFHLECTVSFFYNYFNSSFNEQRTGIDVRLRHIQSVWVNVTDNNPFYNTTVTLTCVITKHDLSPFDNFQSRWTPNITTEREIQILAITDEEYTCEATVDTLTWIPSDNSQTIWIRYIKSAFVNATKNITFPGTNVTLSCVLDLLPGIDAPNDVTYLWSPDNSTGKDVEIYVTSEVEYRCTAFRNNLLFPSENSVIITLKALPKPRLVILDRPEILIVGEQYFITCMSDVAFIALNYIFNSSDGSSQVQISNNLAIVPSEELQEFTCSVGFDDFLSDSSYSINFTGSGIIDVEAEASELTPYPGFYVILDCNVTLTTGYTIANVTFNWKEGITGTANTQSHQRYIDTESSIFTHCVASTGPVEVDSNIVTITPRVLPAPVIDLVPNEDGPLFFNGKSYNFTCSSPISDAIFTSHTWTINGMEIQTISGYYIVLVDGGVSISCATQAGSALSSFSNVLSIIATDIPQPILIVNNEPSDGIYEPGHRHTLVCRNNVRSRAVAAFITSYFWRRDGQIIDNTTVNYFDIIAMSTTHIYTCSYLVISEESTISSQKEIQATSIISVHIENNGEIRSEWKPVFDSVLNLTCVVTFKPRITEIPSYRWMEDHSPLALETKREFNLKAYPGLNNNIICVVTVGDDSQESEPVALIAQEIPIAPRVLFLKSTDSTAGQPVNGNTYTLYCLTETESLNISISWIKDETEILCALEARLHISRYSSRMNDGNYRCRIGVFNQIVESDTIELQGIEPVQSADDV